ncbi:MAG TPA: ATP-binding protein [Polyangiaceae bacterium]
MTLEEDETRGAWAEPDPDARSQKPRKFLLLGNPGSGKVVKARELARESRLWFTRDSARLYAFRVAGLPPLPSALEGHLRAPHHSVNALGMTGRLRGHMWRPGEIALAHGGTLLLDEAPEFRLDVLDAVWRAWMAGRIDLWSEQACNRLTIPTEFDLILSMNPCPCGWRGHSRQTCQCTDRQVARWFDRVAKLSEGAERIELSQTLP